MCGYAIFLNNNLIHYKAKLQSVVCLSSTEAEYIALSLGLKDLMWIQNILNELNINLTETNCYCDNQGSIKMAHNEQSTSKTRHLDIKLQFVKTLVQSGRVNLKYISGDANCADIFTKGLAKPLFSKFRQQLVTAYRQTDAGN